jgi:hypothetical protein
VVAIHGLDRGDGEAGRVAIDEEEGDARSLALAPRAAGRDHEGVGGVTVPHPALAAVEVVATVALRCPRDHVSNVVAALGLGVGQRERGPALQRRGEEGLLLLGAAEAGDGEAGDERGDQGLGDQRRAELLQDQRDVGEAPAEAAGLFGEGHGDPAVFAHLLPDLLRPADGVTAQLAEAGDGGLLLREGSGRVGEELLLVGEIEVHGVCPLSAQPRPRMSLAMMLRWISLEPP